jgi:cytosine/adenosine deaminase-related metal-dependent hydrolase
MPFVIPGFSAVEELRQLRRAGLPAAAVLRAATHGGAVLMRRTTEFGRVAAGLRADLILVDDNPLADVEHVTRRSGVMVAGRWMPERWLQERMPRY